ncbi:MAG: hypoxanthine phosphoribosyltransferase [Deltaproteobacteria bacterium]|nr:hypoxanthine phosphoribosyltransferase [Deltaproteobacteria bacterium]
MPPHEKERVTVLAPDTIQERVRQLAQQISQDLAGEKLVVLGILKGAFIFLSDLVRHLDVPCQVDFVRLSSYGSSAESSGTITMTQAPEIDLTGRTVLVVEDIVDTGLTLQWLLSRIQEMNPGSIKTCTLIDKPERRRVEVSMDYVGFHVPEGFLVGYGLDFDECFRHLPGIYELKF